jgi:hypothetical protein
MNKLLLGRIVVTGLMVGLMALSWHFHYYYSRTYEARIREEADRAARIMLKIVEKHFREHPYDKLRK